MSKNEIIEKLRNLRVEIHDYAKYLKESTYHPYDKVEQFSYDLKQIINMIENEYE